MDLHQLLSSFNHSRITPSFPDAAWRERLEAEIHARSVEMDFLDQERTAIRDRASTAPDDVDGFITWFEGLKQNGPGQGDALFPWLANTATTEQMRWFLSQEVAGEAGFEDLVALSQLKIPTKPKLEMARNYWDELGRGREIGMHGPMLERLAVEANVAAETGETVWEAVALGNLMMGLANNPTYRYQAIGALGVIELTAPGRAALVNEGLKRLNFGKEARTYFSLHATLDLKHSADWNREVLRPLVEENPLTAQALAEGALMRLEAGARCFKRYRTELGVPS